VRQSPSRRPRVAVVGGRLEDRLDTPIVADGLRRRRLLVDLVSWRAPSVAWDAYDLVLLRSCWDYIEDVESFLCWLKRVARQTTLLNTADQVAWNLDKRYLRDLEDAGVQTVPTHTVEPGAAAPLDQLFDEWGEIVIKPSRGAGSWMVGRYTAAATEAASAHIADLHRRSRTALVQPCLSQVVQHGERGVYLFDGDPIYMIAKSNVLPRDRPPRDDFQLAVAQHIQVLPVDDQLASFATDTLGRIPGPTPLYARVDIAGTGQEPQLLELELIEPVLFLDRAPAAAADRLCSAITSRISPHTPNPAIRIDCS
jgi:glutathione synthase/RimK-type ligase-like ATP-grasp enzyme